MTTRPYQSARMLCLACCYRRPTLTPLSRRSLAAVPAAPFLQHSCSTVAQPVPLVREGVHLLLVGCLRPMARMTRACFAPALQVRQRGGGGGHGKFRSSVPHPAAANPRAMQQKQGNRWARVPCPNLVQRCHGARDHWRGCGRGSCRDSWRRRRPALGSTR